MEGVFNAGATYTIPSEYIQGTPSVNVGQIGGANYDGFNNGKYYSFCGDVKIIPIGFDDNSQNVIVTTGAVESHETRSEIYANYSEMRHRKIQIDEVNLPALGVVSKENFIKYAKLVSISQ